jgi:hypothetical protein
LNHFWPTPFEHLRVKLIKNFYLVTVSTASTFSLTISQRLLPLFHQLRSTLVALHRCNMFCLDFNFNSCNPVALHYTTGKQFYLVEQSTLVVRVLSLQPFFTSSLVNNDYIKSLVLLIRVHISAVAKESLV